MKKLILLALLLAGCAPMTADQMAYSASLWSTLAGMENAKMMANGVAASGRNQQTQICQPFGQGTLCW